MITDQPHSVPLLRRDVAQVVRDEGRHVLGGEPRAHGGAVHEVVLRLEYAEEQQARASDDTGDARGVELVGEEGRDDRAVPNRSDTVTAIENDSNARPSMTSRLVYL